MMSVLATSCKLARTCRSKEGVVYPHLVPADASLDPLDALKPTLRVRF